MLTFVHHGTFQSISSLSFFFFFIQSCFESTLSAVGFNIVGVNSNQAPPTSTNMFTHKGCNPSVHTVSLFREHRSGHEEVNHVRTDRD